MLFLRHFMAYFLSINTHNPSRRSLMVLMSSPFFHMRSSSAFREFLNVCDQNPQPFQQHARLNLFGRGAFLVSGISQVEEKTHNSL